MKFFTQSTVTFSSLSFTRFVSSLAFLFVLLTTGVGNAQNAKWVCTTSFTPTVCGVTSATAPTSGAAVTSVSATPNATSGYSGASFPVSSTAPTTTTALSRTNYQQFSFTNTTGSTITFNNESLTAYYGGTGATINDRVAWFYSLNAFVTSSVQLATGLTVTAGSTATSALTTSIAVATGSTLTVRVFHYWTDATTATCGVTNLTFTATPADPGSFSAAAGNTQNVLSSTANAASNNVVLAWNTTNTFGTPVQGTNYAFGNSIAGGGTVLYNGAAGSNFYTHTALTNGTQYFYKLWSVNSASGCSFSTGLTANATPSAPTYTSIVANGDWNTAATWSVSTGGNGVPTAGSTVIVNTNVSAASTPTNQPKTITVNTGFTLTLGAVYTNPSGSTVTVATGGILAVGASYTNTGTTVINGTFQINNSGFGGGAGTWTYGGASTLIFNTSGLYGAIDGSHTYWPASGPFNVTVQNTGGINLSVARTVAGTFQTTAQVTGSSALTFTGTCQINALGYFSTTPTYGAASTLIYAAANTSGSPYGVGNEWTGSSATAGSGIPNNVTINNNTFITMPNGDRGMSGAFNVTSGSGITLHITAGNLSMGGDFTQNGTLTHNGRAINFFGTTATTQTITGSGLNTPGATNCFAYFLNNTSGTGGVTIGTNASIYATAGDVLQLLNAGPLKIGAFTLTLDGSGGNIQTSGGVRVIDFTSASGVLLLKGTSGTLKTVTSASSGSLSITSSTAGGQVQVQSGGFNCGSTTIQTGAFLTINTGGYVDTNSPTYATGSTLSFRTGAAYGIGSTDKTWASGASGVGVPDKVQINAAGTDVQINDNRTAITSVTVTAGTLTNNTNTLNIATTVTAAATALNVNGGTLSNAGGTINIGASGGGNQALSVAGGAFTLSSGTINLNGNYAQTTGSTFTQSGGTLVIDGNSGTAGTSTGSGVNLFSVLSSTGSGVNCTAGTIRIVDPPHSSLTAGTTKAVHISYGTVAPSSFQFSGTHTFEFGNGSSTTGGNLDGFVIDTFVSTYRIPLRNVTVNSGATANRWVSTAYTAGNGTNINGTLTINASCEFRNTVALTTTPFTISGNIANAGTLTSTQTIQFALNDVAGGAPVTNTAAQTVSGAGTFQNLTSAPTAKFTNLTFNNSTAGSAVTFSIGDVTLTGAATFTNGIIDIGNNNSFNFGVAATVARTNGYVLIQGTGQMKKDFPASALAFIYHVGENTGTTEYSPYSLSFTANSLARTIGVRPVDAAHPSIDDVDVQTDYISRYWQLSNSAAGTYTYTATATYLPADIVGTQTNMKMNLWTGATPWSQLASSAAANVLTITSGVTNVSAPLGGTADFTGRVKGSTTYTWDGSTDSVWSTASNWTPDRNTPAANDILIFDGTSTPTPTVTGFASETISKLLLTNSVNLNLQPTTTATLTIAGGTGTDLDIPSGSTLNLSGGASAGITYTGSTTTSIAGTLTFSSTAGTPTLDLTNTIATVTGTINLSSTSNVTVTSSSTSLLMNASSTLNITNGMATIPLATWDTASTLVLAGSGASGFSNLAQSFGNFTYNSSSITATLSFFTTNTTTIKGNLNVQATGTGAGRLRLLTTGTLTVNGNVNIGNAAVVDFINGAASFTVTGNVNVSNTATLNFANGAGTISIGGNVTASDASIINFGNAAGANTTTITGNLNLNSSATSVLSLTSGSTQVVSVAGNFTQTAGTLSMGTGTGAGTLKVAGSFTAISLNNPGTGTANLIEFNGTTSQAVSPGGSVTGVINIRVSNPSGIVVTGTLPMNNGTTFTAASSGTAVTSGTVTYGTTTTLSYTTAVGAQTTGAEFPSTSGPVNVIFNNTFATTPEVTLSGSGTVTGTLTITAGRVLLGNNDLTLANGGTQTITTPGTTKMIVTNGTGLYKRGIPATTGTYVFPIGDITGTIQYSPVSLQFTANSAIRIVGAKVIDAASSNLTTGGTPTNYLSRYWTFSENGAGGTYNYYINPAVASTTIGEDEVGTASLITPAYWNGTSWTVSSGTYTTGSLVSNATGVSETTGPLGTVEWTGRATPPVAYTWVGFTDGVWGTAANWSPSGVPGSTDTVTLTNGSTGAAANLSLTTAVTVNDITFNGTGSFFTVGAAGSLTTSGTVTYTSGSGSWNATSTFAILSASSQTIPAFAYGNITGTGGARVWTAGTTSIAGTFTPGAGAYTATSGSTVDFNGAGSQTIGAVNYNNLTISGARGTATITLASGIIDVSGSYTKTATGTLSVASTGNTVNFSSASSQTIPAFVYNNITNTGNGPRTLASSGSIQIVGTTFTPGSGVYTVTGSTVDYSNATGFTIPTLPPAATNNYNNLTISGAGTFTLAGSTTLSGNLNQSAGNINVSNASANPTLSIGGSLNLSGGAFRLITSSTATGATVNVTGNVAISLAGKINLESTSSASGVAVMNVTGDFTSTGVTVASTGANGVVDFGTGTVGGNTITIGGNFDKSGVGTMGTASGSAATGFVFNKAGTQTFKYAGAASDYINYTITSTPASTLQLLSNLTISTASAPVSTVTVNGTLDSSTFAVDGGATNGTFILAAGATLKTANPNGVVSTTVGSVSNSIATRTFNAGANYEFYGTAAIAANFPNTTMNNLTNSNTNTTTQGASITVNGDLGLTSGTLASGTNTIALSGNITGTGTHTSSGAGILTMSGASKTISGATLGILTLNNAAGFSLIGSPTLNGNLTFTNGDLDLSGSNNITLGATVTVTGETCSRQFTNTGSPTQGNGYVQTTRTFVSGTNYLGVAITTATALGSTNIKRFVQKSVTTTGGTATIKRVYSITPTSAATGNVTLTSSYCDGELNGNTESPVLLTYYGTGTDETTGYSSVYATASNDATANTVTTGTTGSLIAGQNNITLANAGPDAYYTVANGDWNTAATWILNAVPPTTADVTVKNIVTVAVADATANSLKIDASDSVTVASGFNLNVTDTIVNNGTLTIENNGNLLQTNNVANTGSGSTIVKRNSSLLKRLDYTLWSSPVTGQGLYAFSKYTMSNRFYVYDEANDFYSNALVGFSFNPANFEYPSPLVSPLGVNGIDDNNVSFANGKAYLIRVPYNHPTTPFVYNGVFTGVANNGTISATVTTTLNGYNAVGNPYPSRLNVKDFIDGNTNIDGTLYFWRKTNTTAMSTSYATLTKTAYTANGAIGGDTGTGFFPTSPAGASDNWVINVGQGFIVKATGGTSISFSNTMRRSLNADQFFKNSTAVNTVSNGLYWLNLIDNSGVYSQMAVGYSAEGTVGFDRGIDGKNINKEFYLTSLIDADEYSIQGRPDFDSSDVVPLSYKAVTAGNYSIAIDHTDGLFTDVSQPIYVRDILTDTYHDLNTGAYAFDTAAGTFTNRFEIVYALPLGVGNPTFAANQVVIYNQNNVFVVKSGTIDMASIKVFDIRGRLIEEKKGINATQTTIGGGLANEVLLVQITSVDGVTVTKKVVR
ncbi:hypothetical protein QWY90_11660 [Flavobacterium paronense]|uniref:Fibronectin type-III domain-containing protein n=1 Tax=Flavobacterium paronense TaxID=1392775 RepID=A0ABV5GEF2_9FLAO|nr:hypothetical protein [Flavobacterium paronense]MDN3677965.1 hypothetical protein [Flavobacterium paronense]